MMREETINPANELSAFLSDLTFEEIPAEAVNVAERAIVDTIGVTLAGAAEEAGTIAATLQSGGNGNEERGASVLGHGTRASIPEAAFINSTAAHGIDFDDSTPVLPGHPSVVLVPPILALAEANGSTGREVVTAYVGGFETLGYLSKPIRPEHYKLGWHATSTIGVFGAAGAAAKLLGLSSEQIQTALNIAASTAAGLKLNFGTMTKPMHAGQATRSGVTAAMLAANGYTAHDDAISEAGGFFDLYGGTSEVTLSEFENDWELLNEGITVKKYPCCLAMHTSIVGTTELVRDHSISPQDVSSITVRASRMATDALPYSSPESVLQAKFSMEYGVASALYHDSVDLESFSEETVSEIAESDCIRNISVETDPDLPYDTLRSSTEIRTRDGDVFEQTVEDPPGTPEKTLTEAELSDKFVDCTSRTVPTENVEALYDSLRHISRQTTATDFLRYV